MKSWNLFVIIIFNIASLLNSTKDNSISTNTNEVIAEDKKIIIKEIAHEKCSVSNYPGKRGKCTLDNQCKCFDGYLSIDDDNFPFYCNYEQKKQITAFLLEFFIGFGIGHLYVGNVDIALDKLITFFTTYFIICFIPYFTAQTKSNCLSKFLPCLHTLSILTIIV